MHDVKTVEAEWQDFGELLCRTDPADVLNSDDFAVFDRSFPGRSVCTSENASFYK